jgi:hypothetical protein
MVPPRIKAVVLVTTIALLSSGCGMDCEGICEEQKQCDGEDKARDCAEYCEDAQQLVETANCEDQWDKLTNCTGGQDDICRPDVDACRSESIAYTDCMGEYCVDHRADCD